MTNNTTPHAIHAERLDGILRVQSYTGHEGKMKAHVKALLEGFATLSHDKAGNIYAHVANGLPLAVAHLDTVHRIDTRQHLVPVQVGEKITGIFYPSMQQAGIGGDDKCGIYAAVELIRAGLCNGFFPVEEESGCTGSWQANLKTLHKWGTPFAMQADRRGFSDIVFSVVGDVLAGPDFRQAVEEYSAPAGYEATEGMITDVWALVANGAKFPAFNISAGYYNPHSDDEYIDLSDLARTVGLMFDIAANLAGRKFDNPQHHQRSRKGKTTYTTSKGARRAYFADDWGPVWDKLDLTTTSRAHQTSPADDEGPTIDPGTRYISDEPPTDEEVREMEYLGLNPYNAAQLADFREYWTT